MIRILVFVFTLLLSSTAFAADATIQCYTGLGGANNWTPCSPTYPFSFRSGTYGAASNSAAPQYCQITSLATAKNLTTANCSSGSILANATIAQICVEAQAVRYTSSGVVTPTASVGMPAASGACFQYAGPLTTIQFIQQTSGAILNVETFP